MTSDDLNNNQTIFKRMGNFQNAVVLIQELQQTITTTDTASKPNITLAGLNYWNDQITQFVRDGNSTELDTFLKTKIKAIQLSVECDPSLCDVPGANTDRHDFAPQTSGLWAIFAGLAHNISDDNELLALGMVIYDGLYSWAKHLYMHKHTQAPVEKLLLEVFQKYLQSEEKKVPGWAKDLRKMIQNQIDTNFNLSLEHVSRELDINPTYLSREFSKYFENLSFGEYIRKMRIERGYPVDANHGLFAYRNCLPDPLF